MKWIPGGAVTGGGAPGELDLELEDLESLREDRGAPVEVQWRWGCSAEWTWTLGTHKEARVSFTNCAF